jgi:hypothetical protein
MESKIIFWAFGLFFGYILLRLLIRAEPKKDICAEVLTSDKYKVKGQWDR